MGPLILENELKLMLSLISCRSGIFRKKGNFDELTMKLYLEIGHNRTTRKKGNPKSSLKTESYKNAPIFCNHVAIILSGAQDVYLSVEPLPHLVLSPLPVESLDSDVRHTDLCA